MSNVFAPSLTASCRQLSATLHGVVFHILVGSANRLDFAAPVRVANGNLGQQGRFRPGHIGNRTPRAFRKVIIQPRCGPRWWPVSRTADEPSALPQLSRGSTMRFNDDGES